MRGVRKAFGVLACSVVAVLGWTGQASALNFSIDRPIVALTVGPGEAIQGTIEVANATDQPIYVGVYLQDWQYLPPWDGTKEFAPPGSLPRSAANWISFHPRQLTIPASSKASVSYTVRPPKDQPLEGGYYAVMFFESRLGSSPSPEDEGVTVRYAARIGSMFLISAKGSTVREASLDQVSAFASPASSTVALGATMSNVGNAVLICSGTYFFQAPSNVVAGRGELPQLYLWPGAHAPVSAEWVGSLSPATYHVVMTYDCGEGLVAVGEGQLAAP